MAHSIVWASVATVDENGRPRTRILHPIWEWDGTDLLGWIATVPSPVKKAHLAVHPEMAVSYWTTTHDTCAARLRPDDHPDLGRRPNVRSVCRAAAEPVSAAGHARNGDDDGRGPGAELVRLDVT